MMLAALWKKKKKNKKNKNKKDKHNNKNKTELDEAPALQETVKAIGQPKSAKAAGFDVACFTLKVHKPKTRRSFL